MKADAMLKKILLVLQFIPLMVAIVISALGIHFNRIFKKKLPVNAWLSNQTMSGSKKVVEFYGDRVNPSDKALIICNHFSDGDFIYIQHSYATLAPEVTMAIISKSQVFKLPALGFYLRTVGAAKVTRTDRAKDVRALQKMARLVNTWPAIFPEGRVLNKETLEWSQGKRVERYLPPANNVLLPQPSGVHTLLQSGQYNTIYDLTMTYDGYKGAEHDTKSELFPSALNYVSHKTKGKVHIHFEKLSIDPAKAKKFTLQEVTDLLNNRWCVKEDRLERFIKTNSFE